MLTGSITWPRGRKTVWRLLVGGMAMATFATSLQMFKLQFHTGIVHRVPPLSGFGSKKVFVFREWVEQEELTDEELGLIIIGAIVGAVMIVGALALVYSKR